MGSAASESMSNGWQPHCVAAEEDTTGWSPAMWENFYELPRVGARHPGGQARRPAAAGRPHFARPEAQASGSPALAGRRPASPETPARRRQREQRAQSRMSACGRGSFRAPAQKSCGQLPARMSFCSLLPRACCLSAAFFARSQRK